MAKRIVWTDQAKADLRSIEQAIAWQILKTLGSYVLTGEGRTKQLKRCCATFNTAPCAGPSRVLP
ncbi:MAG: hypothetical protein WBW33_34400 [Bryobacteraceae bacterium]